MKLILETQDGFRIRLTQSEFLRLETEQFLVNSFSMLGDVKFQIKIVPPELIEHKLLRLKFSEAQNAYEVRITPLGIEMLKKPSKSGIEATVETNRGTIHLGVEVDLKHH
jgi:hypothetical protein